MDDNALDIAARAVIEHEHDVHRLRPYVALEARAHGNKRVPTPAERLYDLAPGILHRFAAESLAGSYMQQRRELRAAQRGNVGFNIDCVDECAPPPRW